MGLRTFLRAQTLKLYWWSRRQLRRLQSAWRVKIALSGLRIRRTRGAARSLGLLVRRALPTVVISALMVGGAIWIDSSSWTPMVPATPSGGALYGALAGFAGVFLGFYYTALGIVIEQVYARGSRTLRRLVISGRSEEVYVWFVVFLGVASLMLLAIETVGYATGIASVALVSLAGAMALVGASRLMYGGLRYFDSAVLASEARAEFERFYRLVDDRPTGNVVTTAARMNARPFLDVLNELAETGDPKVGHEALILLQEYWATKPERTTLSAWWAHAVVRPDWFLSSSTQVGMAMKGRGQIRAEFEPDWLWVERPLVRSITKVLKQLLQSGDWEEAHGILVRIANTVRQGSSALLVNEAAILLEAAADTLLKQWSEDDIGAGRVRAVRPADLWDAYGGCVAQFLIGARLGWKNFAANFETALAEVPAQKPGEAQKLWFPLRRKDRLHALAERLEFEAVVEGETPTPQWYWADFVAPTILWELKDQFERVEQVVDRLQGDIRPGLSGSPLASTTAARRTMEIRYHWRLFRDEAHGADEILRALIRSEDYDLPSMPFERAERFDVREQIEDALWLSNDALSLFRLEDDPAAEELLGYMYARLMDRCVAALTTHDREMFEAIFSKTFRLAVALDGRVPFRGRELMEMTQTKVSVQPVLDLMALSGLALIRDEVSGPGYWEPVRAAWDWFLDRAPEPQRSLERLLFLTNNASGMFGVGARWNERSRWSIDLANALRKEGVSMGLLHATPGQLPSRPILRASLSGVGGLGDPIVTFATVYLAARPESVGLDLGSRVSSFLQKKDGSRKR